MPSRSLATLRKSGSPPRFLHRRGIAFLLTTFGALGCGSVSMQNNPLTAPDPPQEGMDTPTGAMDNFLRPDGPLGPNWSVLGSDGGIQLLDHAFAPTDGSQNGFPTAVATWAGSHVFAPNQYAKVQISAIAPEQSTVTITAATLSGSNTIYTYALTGGQALQTPQPINIAGMADAGNNGAFVISELGQGTFTVPNPSGVTATNQTGTGISATDSLCGPAVRSTPGVLNGYFVYIGNNSGYVARDNGATDGRVYVVELWKLVNGAIQEIKQVSTDDTIADSVGDVYHLFALNNKVALYKNGTLLSADFDSSLTSGTPGIIASSATGAGHTMPLGANVGVSGTHFTNWVGSDAPSTPSGWVAQASTTFLTGGGAKNPPWSQAVGFPVIPYFGNSGEMEFGGRASLVYTGRTWADDQSSSIVVSSVTQFTSLSLLVRASTSAETFYVGQFHFNNGLGPGTFSIAKMIDGTATSLATVPGTVNFADVLRLEVTGSTLNLKQNGATVLTATDSSITSGSPGITGGGNAYVMFWEGDEVAP